VFNSPLSYTDPSGFEPGLEGAVPNLTFHFDPTCVICNDNSGTTFTGYPSPEIPNSDRAPLPSYLRVTPPASSLPAATRLSATSHREVFGVLGQLDLVTRQLTRVIAARLSRCAARYKVSSSDRNRLCAFSPSSVAVTTALLSALVLDMS
jgi:hypothetical protein